MADSQFCSTAYKDQQRYVMHNSLPSNIRKIDKLQTFKSKLKTHLFEKAYKSM